MYPFKSSFQPVDGSSNISHLNNPVIDESQWPNQAAYQHIDLEKVDWAALAQQWIHMKETFPKEDEMPNAPPPPNISMGRAPPPPNISMEAPPPPNFYAQKTIPLSEMEEKGEAPMEVERDDEMSTPSFQHQQQHFAQSTKNNQGLAAWGYSGQSNQKVQSNQQSHQQHNDQSEPKPWQKKPPGWNTWTNPKLLQHHNRPPYRPPLLMDPYVPNSMYTKPETNMWPPNSNGSLSNEISANHGFPGSPPSTVYSISKPGIDLNIDIMPTILDAAQRKSLPAWIREGLEKMERSKQKEAERERELKERDEMLKRRKLEEQNFSEIGEDLAPSAFHIKSKFESESDDSSSDGEELAASKVVRKRSHSRSPPPKLKPHRTKTEILQDIMLLVRPNLTEILLEVTNEEIDKIATDVYSKTRLKGFKGQTVRKNALTSISGGLGLGLGIYADSDGSQSDSGSDNEAENSKDSANDDVSDSELKDTIDRRKRAFEKASLEIEASLAKEEERERLWLEQEEEANEKPVEPTKRANLEMSSSRAAPNTSVYGISKDSGEIQHEKNILPAGRKLEKRQSRFSDSKVAYHIQPSSVVPNNIPSTGYGLVEAKKKDSPRRGHESDTSSTSSRGYHRQKSDRSSKYEDDDRDHRSKVRKTKRGSRSGSESSYISKSSHRSSRKHSRRSSSRSRRDRSRSRDRSRERSRRSDRDERDDRSSSYYRSSKSDRSSHREYKSSKKRQSRSRSRSRSHRRY